MSATPGARDLVSRGSPHLRGADLDPTLRRRERITAGGGQDVVGRAEPLVAVHPDTYEYIDVQKVAPRHDNCAR